MTDDKVVVFELNGCRFGVELSRVITISQLPELTPIPVLPAYFAGVCNLHGNIVPVADLAVILQIPHQDEYRCLLLLRYLDAEVAIMADNVIETLSFDTALKSAADGESADRYIAALLPDKTAVLNMGLLLDVIFKSEVRRGEYE